MFNFIKNVAVKVAKLEQLGSAYLTESNTKVVGLHRHICSLKCQESITNAHIENELRAQYINLIDHLVKQEIIKNPALVKTIVDLQLNAVIQITHGRDISDIRAAYREFNYALRRDANAI